jgi:outer membrane protein assembly factor BamA
MSKRGVLFFICLCLKFIPSANAFSEDDSLKIVEIKQIILLGNKVTRNHIMYRELAFKPGDTLSLQALADAIQLSRQNLLNTSLFNFVTITHQLVDDHFVYVIIDVIERWYIFPVPIFELVDRNFNEWWKDKNFKKANYGFYLNWDNFRGRRETLSILMRYGYSQRQGFTYAIPYIDKYQNNGLIIAAFQARQHEIPYALSDNKLQYYKNPSLYVFKEYRASLAFTHRKGFNKTYTLFTEYHYKEIDDSLLKLNPDFFNTGQKKEAYPALVFEYKDDARDYRNYPLKGYFLQLTFAKNGFGITPADPSNTHVILAVKKFNELSPRWHVAGAAKAKYSGNSDIPFYNQMALGYRNDIIRGYENYVITGENYCLFKTGIKYTLIKPADVNIPVRVGKRFSRIPYSLYVNIFADAGYVRNKRFYANNLLSNSWQYSSGIGFDFVTYYDIVLRTDFAINKFGNSGFFIHLTAPI